MSALRVMTFNIRLAIGRDGANRWYRRRDLVFGVLREHRPHLAGLQEALTQQLDEILGALPGYGAVADRRYAGRQRGTYAPILFDAQRLEPQQSGEFWLAPDPDGGRARGWDAAVPRLAAWAVFADRADDGRRFAVLNTHFDQAGELARVRSAELVVERLAALAPRPRLVTADLNASEASPALEVLLEAGFRDTYRDQHPDGEAPTFHGFRGRGARTLGKIDYVLRDASWRVLGAEIVRDHGEDGYPSDHFPVTAEVALKG